MFRGARLHFILDSDNVVSAGSMKTIALAPSDAGTRHLSAELNF